MTAPKDWRDEAIARAIKPFRDRRFLRRSAACIAQADPYGADYLEQAPIIAWGLPMMLSPTRTRERDLNGLHGEMIREFRRILSEGRKLKHVMAALGLPLPMRLVRAEVMSLSWQWILEMLASTEPAVLGEVLDGPASHQRYFMAALDRFGRGQWPEAYRRWAVGAVGHAMKRRLSGAQTPGSVEALAADVARDASVVADYLWRAPQADFDPRWSLAEACAAAMRWHRQLADNARRYALEAMARTSEAEVADYGTMPLEKTIGAFSFVALRTERELLEEGAVLHHCVGSYWPSVQGGFSRIYGVRRGDRRVATMELAPHGRASGVHGWGTARLVQLRGPCNMDPVPDVRAAVVDFCAEVFLLDATQVSDLGRVLGLNGKTGVVTLDFVTFDPAIQQALRRAEERLTFNILQGHPAPDLRDPNGA